MKKNTKIITLVALLSAFAYVIMAVGRIPVVQFLKYDPKDVVIVIGGFILGPLYAALISVVVSTVEMFTVSTTGFYGLVMNVVSSCAFACVASAVYKRKHTMKGAVLGLSLGVVSVVACMLLWNYMIAPLYMGQERSAIVPLLFTMFLPFNLFKGMVNMALSLLLYKPVVVAMRRTNLIERGKSGGRINPGIVLLGVFILVMSALLYLVLSGKI